MTLDSPPSPLHLKPFYLLRHGESEANLRQAVAGGNLDSPLTERGIQQAKDLARQIEYLQVKPSCIYHSPLSRAAETARLVNQSLGLEMIVRPDLKEHIFGDWENKPWSAIKIMIDKGVEPPNGETYLDFTKRVQSAFNTILSEDHSSPPLLVAHGGIFNAIARLYDQKFGEIENCILHYFVPLSDNQAFPWEITLLKPSPQEGLSKDKFRL